MVLSPWRVQVDEPNAAMIFRIMIRRLSPEASTSLASDRERLERNESRGATGLAWREFEINVSGGCCIGRALENMRREDMALRGWPEVIEKNRWCHL